MSVLVQLPNVNCTTSASITTFVDEALTTTMNATGRSLPHMHCAVDSGLEKLEQSTPPMLCAGAEALPHQPSPMEFSDYELRQQMFCNGLRLIQSVAAEQIKQSCLHNKVDTIVLLRHLERLLWYVCTNALTADELRAYVRESAAFTAKQQRKQSIPSLREHYPSDYTTISNYSVDTQDVLLKAYKQCIIDMRENITIDTQKHQY
eukprot:m.1638370 g.1638370  ORF g.1638370 m.1638370 type:complete len:205 (+) comp27800_c0_seq1:848-1462(+)